MRKTPVPIPNTVEKTHISENTWRATAWEDNPLPAPFLEKRELIFSVLSFFISIFLGGQVNISKVATKFFIVSSFVGVLTTSEVKASAQNKLDRDTVELSSKVSPEGTSDTRFLKYAPKPELVYMGEKENAKFVVTLGDNRLYQYNSDGEPIKVYSIATGKVATPTEEGVRVVSHVESFPYLTAPRTTKRRRNPRSYGPKIIILDKILSFCNKSVIFIHSDVFSSKFCGVPSYSFETNVSNINFLLGYSSIIIPLCLRFLMSIPVSSFISLIAVCSGSSPSSIFPPGMS